MIRGVPYDHQLEYIESTGTQWIDTGIYLASDVGISITGTIFTTSTAQYPALCGAQTESYDAYAAVYQDGNTTLFETITESQSCSVLCRSDVQFTGRINFFDDGVIHINERTGGSPNDSPCTMPSINAPICAFCVGTPSGANDFSHGRIYSLRITKGAALVRDLIPVLVGTTALMYDRVTGTFPKHYGTFVAGPVASTPIMGVHIYQQVCTAADYIQDGLVAMIDGIENAGWGIHSENSYPINLVDGSAISVNGGVSLGRDYFMFDVGQWGYFTCEQFASAIEQKKFTVEIVAKNNRVSNAGVISVGSRGVWMYSDPSHNLQTLNILSSSYIPSPQINFRSDSYWRAVIQGGEQPTIDVNGMVVNAQYGSQTSVSSPVVYIGSLTGNPSWSNGKMWTRSLRIYSKLLTEGEKNHNKNVDMNRRFLDDDAE